MTNPQKALILSEASKLAIQDTNQLRALLLGLRDRVFVKGIHYGIIPGTNDKPVLLLPGMEAIMHSLKLRAEYKSIDSVIDFAVDGSHDPFFFFRYECRIIDIETGIVVSTAIGSTNSYEDKWRWRWVKKADVPPELPLMTLKTRAGSAFEFQFAIDKAETIGKYGKPVEYWAEFRQAIEDGTALHRERETKNGTKSGWEIETTLYRVPNQSVYDLVNTMDKIAQKRALASAIKIAANASEFFDVDIEGLEMEIAEVNRDLHVADEKTEKNQESGSLSDPATKSKFLTDLFKQHGMKPPDVYKKLGLKMAIKKGEPDPLAEWTVESALEKLIPEGEIIDDSQTISPPDKDLAF